MKISEAVKECQKNLLPTKEDIKTYICTIFEDCFNTIPDEVIKNLFDSGFHGIELQHYRDKFIVFVLGIDEDKDISKKIREKFKERSDFIDKMLALDIVLFRVDFKTKKVKISFNGFSKKWDILTIEDLKEKYPGAICPKERSIEYPIDQLFG